MKINNCTSCGGKIEFSPNDKAIKCINCGNLYPIELKKEVRKHAIGWLPSDEELKKWSENSRAVKCKTCGAQITFNKFDIATKCQYCNSSSMLELNELPGLRPEIVVPFKIDKIQAKTQFGAKVKKRHFLPNNFRKNLPKTEVGATYISSFTFDCFVNASYSGRQKFTHTERDRQGRTRTVTTYRSFSGKIDKQFNNLVVECSDKLSQNEILSVFPYDFDESYDFDDDFIKGYNVGYYNQSVESAEQVAKQDAYNKIERIIRGQYSNIDTLTIDATYSNVVYNYALLPIYFINFNYKNKTYTNIMNGQNGNITGKVPRSPVQITLFTLFIILLVGLPILLILLN